MVAALHPAPTVGRILNGSFAMITDQVSMDRDLSPGARLTYVILVARAGRTGWCEDSLDELGAAYGASARQMQRLLDELLEDDKILERPNPAKRGRAKMFAPIVGLTDARLQQVLAYPGERQRRRANTTNMSYLMPPPLVPNTTDPATDPSCLEPLNTTDLSLLPEALKDRSGDTTDGIPESSGGGGRSAAAAAIAPSVAVVPEPTTAPSVPRVSPPKSPATDRRKPRTPAPKTIPLTDELLAWATSKGYTREIVEREVERCLTKHEAIGTLSSSWTASLRNWLLNEIEYARKDGRALGDHGGNGRARAVTEVDGVRYRKDGSRIYTSEAGSKMPADLQALIDKNTRY